MNNEFKKVKSNEETRYVLETATAGATSSGAVATVPGSAGKVQKRNPDNILAQEANKTEVPANKPRNFVAKNAKMGGAGAHKDKKKAQKQGQEKHKKPYMEALKSRLAELKSKLAEMHDNPEYNDEAGMADNNLETLERAVQGIDELINAGDNLPEWCQEKIAVAKSMLVTVWDYMKSEEDRGATPDDASDNEVAEGGMKDYAIQQVVDQLLDGDLDPYDVMNRPQGPAQEQMAAVLQDMYDDVAMDYRLHPDDDFEQIFDRVMDRLEDEYGHSGDQGVSEEPDQYMESLAQNLYSAINEKAVSKAQQRFMGMVHAAQKGEKPASKEVAKAAKGMGKKDAKDFASTKHKGLPEKKPKK